MDSTIPPLINPKFQLSIFQTGLRRTWSESGRLVFWGRGSYPLILSLVEISMNAFKLDSFDISMNVPVSCDIPVIALKAKVIDALLILTNKIK